MRLAKSLLFLALSLSSLTGACAAEPVPTTPAPEPVPRDTPPPPETKPVVLKEGLVVGDPAEEGIEPTALAALVSKAEQQHSEALVVVKNGKLVYENLFGTEDQPIVAMSASKSFTSLAYGFLLADGKLASFDETIATKLPAFASGPTAAWKAKVTYRHLLSQTAGLDPERAGGTKGDIEATGIAAPCIFEPGTSWQYSNNGIDFLAAMAGRLAGKSMDEYLNEKLFRPMGIADVSWVKDKKGVPLGAGEMAIRPLDMAKVGLMLLDGGRWQDKTIVAKSWIDQSFAQSSTHEPLYGLLWWREADVKSVGLTNEILAQWKALGFADTSAAKLAPLVGQKYADYKKYRTAMRGLLDLTELSDLETMINAGNHVPYARNLEIGAVRSANAAGWLGQFLVVSPEKRLVAVRMRRAKTEDYAGGAEKDGFNTFPADVVKIAP